MPDLSTTQPVRLATALLLFACVPWTLRAWSQDSGELKSSALAQVFGAAPSIADPGLSPDGRQMHFLQQNAGGAADLRVLDFASGGVHTPLIGFLDGQDVAWCKWAKVARLVCALTDTNHRRGMTRPDTIVTFIAIDSDGTDLQRLRWLCEDGIDWLPDEPRHVFIHCPPEMARLDLYSNQYFPHDIGMDVSPQLTVSDGQGSISLFRLAATNEYWWYARPQTDGDWERFRTIEIRSFEDPLRPVGFGDNRDEALHIALNSGTWSLFAIDIAAGFSNRLVFSHPVVDVTHVDRFGARPRVVAAVYDFNGPQRFIIDARVAEVHAFVSARLPDRSIDVIDESWDQNVFLVRARAQDRAGEFYRVDMSAGALENVGAEYAHLLGVALAPSQTIEITAGDGSRFSAHLTLPPGRDGPVPAVLIPRGAPSPLDLMSPNYLVQYMAHSGYAVLRVNQRGPPQYGSGWTEDRVFVGRQQAADDIRRAGEYLVESGVALPGRLCALGIELGAYAAVMSAIAYPDLLECIVSIRGTLTPQLSRLHVERSNNPLLEEPLPARQAGKIHAAVLLFDDTSSANARSSAAMGTRLRRAGQEVQLIEYDHSDPQIRQAPYRVDMLARIGEFLDTRIGIENRP
jgi:dipeptidyl aminopeptidase/acylaminoacyl peptidase